MELTTAQNTNVTGDGHYGAARLMELADGFTLPHEMVIANTPRACGPDLHVACGGHSAMMVWPRITRGSMATTS